MIVCLLEHPDYNPTFVLEVPPHLFPRTNEIREWLREQSEYTRFYPPQAESDSDLPGLLYFQDEAFATTFILRWS